MVRIVIVSVIALLFLFTIGHFYFSTNKTMDNCEWITDYPVYGIMLGDALENVKEKHNVLRTTNDDTMSMYDIRDILPGGCPITLWVHKNKIILIDVRTKDSSRMTYEKILSEIHEKFDISTQEEKDESWMKFSTSIYENEVSITVIYNKGMKQVYVTYCHRELMDAYDEEFLYMDKQVQK